MKKVYLAIAMAFIGLCATAQKIYTFSNSGTVEVKLEATSKPLKEMPDRIPTANELAGERPEKDNPSLERPAIALKPGAMPLGTDPAIQHVYTGNRSASAGSTTSVSVLSNWTGLTAAVQPSDNTIAVGKNQVVQMTNNSISSYIRIWDKAGTLLVNSKLAQSITGIADYGDPNLLYDEQADRFLFVLLYSKNGKKLVVGVSATADPAGSWYTYTFSTPNGFPDYPKIGVWGNSYLVTTNSSAPTIYALNRSAMQSGQAIGSAQVFSLSKFPNIGFQSASPISQAGPVAPPAGSPASVIRVADDSWSSTIGPDHLELYRLNISWTTPSASTISGPFNLNTIAYNSNLCGFGSSACIPQPGSTSKLLDPLSDIVMDKVQYRNLGGYESIVCTHVCNADGNGTAGVRWYELRKSGSADWSIYQQSTWSPGSDNRWMSSIAMNQNGQVALGYNIASKTVYPGICITGRDSCDAINTMTAAETVAKSGAAANSSSRYGDYNGLVVDPVDNSFWFTSNYNPTSTWATNVVHFSISSCPAKVVRSNQPLLTKTNSVKERIRVYPNPAHNQLTIESSSDAGNLQVYITDIAGRHLQQQVINNTQARLNISGLYSGLYFIKIMDSKGKVWFSGKFIKN